MSITGKGIQPMSVTAKQLKELIGIQDYDAIQSAFAAGTDPDIMTDFVYDTACTVLYSAVYYQNPALLEIALQNGANPNLGTKHTSPLRKGVENGHISFCKAIVNAEGFDPQAPQNRKAWSQAESRQGESPRHAQVFRFLQNIYDPDNGCGWHKIDETSVQHVSRTPDQMIEVTTIFNFRAAKLKEITRDYTTGRSDVESTYFADLPQNARGQVIEALTELQKQDGGQDVDPRSLSGVRHIQRSRGKQVQTKS